MKINGPPCAVHRRVIRAYVCAYPEPIVFDAGELLTVERRDAQFPGWLWVRRANGHGGWAPQQILSLLHGDQVLAMQAYEATELSTQCGEILQVVKEIDGWCWARNSMGQCGWVPVETTLVCE